MIRRRRQGAGLATAWAMLAMCVMPAAARAEGEPGTPKYAATVKLRSVSLRALDALWQQAPVSATSLGVHRYDDRMASYAAPARSAQLAQLAALTSQVRAISPAVLAPNDRADRDLILANLEDRRLDLADVKQWSWDPLLYTEECVNGLYYLTLRQGTPVRKRATAAMKRLQQIPRLLAEMRTNVTAPPALLASSAAEQLDAGIGFLRALDEADAPLLASVKPAARAQAIDAACVAMREAATALRVHAARGGAYAAMGRATYEAKMRSVHFLPFDSDSLIRLGERVLRQTQTEYDALSAARASESQWLPAAPVGQDPPAPSSFNRSSILAAYRAEIADVRRFIEDKGLVTIPRDIGDLVPVEVPQFMRPITPGIAMEPAAPFEAPFPGDRTMDPYQRALVTRGTFYVRPIPDSLTDAERQAAYSRMLHHGFRGGVVHEGYPGHHLQTSLANRVIDPVRRAQTCSSFSEGWALYCEELMQRNRLSDDADARINMLRGLRFRACRVIVDAKLQRGDMSTDDAVRFLHDAAGSDSAFASGEVARYCHQPLQALSYLVGKEMIVDLRERYRARHASDFTLRGFHDALLAVGTIPVPLAAQLLLTDVPAVKSAR